MLAQDIILAIKAQTDTITTGLDESKLHDGLDSYANKAVWKNDTTMLDNRFDAIDASIVEQSGIIQSETDARTDQLAIDIVNMRVVIDRLDDLRDGLTLDQENKVDQIIADIAGLPEPQKMNETELHSGLNSYVNKADWKADVTGVTADMDPVLDKLDVVRNDIATLPEPQEMNEAELHAGLDSYTGKDDWKDTADLSQISIDIANVATTVDDVETAVNAIDMTGMTESELHDGLNSYSGKNNWKANTSGIESDIADVQTAVDAVQISVDGIDVTGMSEAELHTGLNNYGGKDDWKLDGTTMAVKIDGIKTVVDGIDTVVDGIANDMSTVSGMTEAELHSGLDSYGHKGLWMGDAADLQPVLDAISGLNNVTVDSIRTAIDGLDLADKGTAARMHGWLDSYTGKDDWKESDKLEESELHTWLNSYANKDDWKATVVPTDLSPILNAIAALQLITLADVEGSTVLAKEATLDSIAGSIAALDCGSDMQPVLDAISGLNDVTPSEVRAAFVTSDFKDKNTESELHTWLDSYASKDNWKADVSEVNVNASVDTAALATAIWDENLGG